VDWSAAGGFHSEILGPKDAGLSEGVGLPGASSDAGALVRLAAEHLHNRGRSLREGDVVVLGRLGEGALLNEARKVTARFQAGRDERRIVFAVRP
jgi:2-keto-4-pentenoate hydratase